MKNHSSPSLSSTLWILLMVSVLSGATQWGRAATIYTWTNTPVNSAATWNTAVNWTPNGIPAAGDTVIFTNLGTAANNSTINNMVSANTTVAVLAYNLPTTSGNFHNTQIPSGVTLTVSGNVLVGSNVVTLATTPVVMSGTGNFITTGGTSGVLDVGYGLSQTATLTLADGTNTIAMKTVNIGSAPSGINGAQATLNLGGGTNTLNADSFTLGAVKANGTIQFAGASGSVAIHDHTGNGRATMLMGNSTAGSGSCVGKLLLAGHPANVMAGTVTLGSRGNGSGSSTGTVTFDHGTFDVTSLLLGGYTANVQSNTSTGTFTVGGDPANTATLTVNAAGGGSFVLGDNTYTTAAGLGVGIFNLNTNGVANVFCSITESPLTGGVTGNLGTMNINGGTLNLEAAPDTVGTLALPLANVNLTNATLNLAVSTTVTNIAVTNLNLGGVANTLNVSSLPPITSYPAQFPLVQWAVANGSFNLAVGSLPDTYTGYLSNNVAGFTIDLVITNGPTPAKAVTWNGNVSGDWDTTTLNWISGGAANYNQSDLVTFDDTLTGTATVNLTTTLNPGMLTVNNNSANYVFTGSGSLGGAVGLTKNGTASLLLDNTAANTFSGGLNINGGTVQVGNNDAAGSVGTGSVTNNGTLIFDRSDNITVANALSGSGGLNQIAAGTLTLSGVSPTYTGNITVQSGTLRTGTTNALGSWSAGTVTITNGATLDLGGIPTANVTVFGGKQFLVAGAGVGGNGAIVNNGPNSQQDAFSQLTLTANTTFGGTNRWDLRNSGATLNQNGFTVTKTGPAETSLVMPVINGGGNYIINQGILSFEVSPVFNGGSGTVTVNGSGILGQYKMNAGAFTLPVTLNGGAIENMATSAGLGVNDSPITLTANSTLIGTTLVGNSLTLNGVITESGGSHGLTKTGASAYILTANETYSGNTIINQGALALSGTGAIPNSPAILLQSNAVFDVSAVSSSWVLGGSQTLSGNGALNGAATLAGIVAPGTAGSIGALTFSNLVTFVGTTTMKLDATGGTNDAIIAPNGVTYGGTLNVSLLTGTVTNGQTFQLFASPAIGGTFSAVTLPSATGLTWTNNLAVDGTLTAGVVSGPAPQPYLTSISLSGTSLVINGTNGLAGESYQVLTTTNLALPVASWTVYASGRFGSDNFSLTNTVDAAAPQNFYLIQIP